MYTLTLKCFAWGVRLQRLNLNRLAGVCLNGGACGLIRQSTPNLTNILIYFVWFSGLYQKRTNWYCMAVVSSCCKMFIFLITNTTPKINVNKDNF